VKLAAAIAGVLAVLLGGVWILQGLNVLPGSFMTGDVRWAMYGSLVALGGIALVVWSRRR
jgi:hypothetical protein